MTSDARRKKLFCELNLILCLRQVTAVITVELTHQKVKNA